MKDSFFANKKMFSVELLTARPVKSVKSYVTHCKLNITSHLVVVESSAIFNPRAIKLRPNIHSCIMVRYIRIGCDMCCKDR